MEMRVVAWVSIGLAVVCAVIIAADEVRRPQKMVVMNVVWPVTALYFSVFAVWAYWVWGRGGAKDRAAQVAVSASHCGAGCMIADVVCEFGIAVAGVTLLGSVLWAEFAIDLAAAWALGIVFQYWAIRPMRPQLRVGGAIIAAIKADTLSIVAFQVGMYAWMALVYFKLFPVPHLTAFDPRYWLMMQLAMVCGFATTLPMNWALLRAGLKEAM
jgi:hypothetical protein